MGAKKSIKSDNKSAVSNEVSKEIDYGVRNDKVIAWALHEICGEGGRGGERLNR